MTSHLNLLPYSAQRRRLLVERLRQWSAVWTAAACIAAGAAWLTYSRGQIERERLAALEGRYAPLKQLQAKTRELRGKIEELREREDLALRIAEERPMAVLLGILSQAALACDGGVCVTRFDLSPGAQAAQRSSGSPQTAPAPHKTLQLEGLGVDNMSVARFAAALRDANVFSEVRLKSSVEAQVEAANAVSYKLECSW